MLKRDITYKDLFTDEEVTETFYFNISKPELTELEFEVEGGFGNYLQQIVRTENHKELVAIIKKIILMSYGERSEDGKRFDKKDEDGRDLSLKFAQTGAYIALFEELATGSDKAVQFILGIFPKEFSDAAEKEVLKLKTGQAINVPTTAELAKQKAEETSSEES